MQKQMEWFMSQTIEAIHQQPEPPIIATIKTKRDSLQVQAVVSVALLLGGFDALDRRAVNDVGEIFVHRADRRFSGRMFQANDKEVVNEARRIEVAIETGDDPDRFVGAVRDLIKIQIVRRNQMIAQ